MANKYIDADELLNEVLGTMFSMSMCLSEQAWRGMKHAQQIFARMIETAPAADVVEIVRCKDCKYRDDDNFCGGRGWPEQLVPDDGYCDKGAKMEEDGE